MKELDSTEAAVTRRSPEAEEVEHLRRRLEIQTRRLFELDETCRKLLRDTEQLVYWMEVLGHDIEGHLHSWSWRIGSTVVAALRMLLLRRPKPTKSLRVFKLLRAFRDWKKENWLS